VKLNNQMRLTNYCSKS